jgi:hypothetical protein
MISQVVHYELEMQSADGGGWMRPVVLLSADTQSEAEALAEVLDKSVQWRVVRVTKTREVL